MLRSSLMEQSVRLLTCAPPVPWRGPSPSQSSFEALSCMIDCSISAMVLVLRALLPQPSSAEELLECCKSPMYGLGIESFLGKHRGTWCLESTLAVSFCISKTGIDPAQHLAS